MPPEDDGTFTYQRPRFGLRPGEVLSRRFRIGKLLGKGGMGEVFEAEDLELGGRVALKIIRPELVEDADFLSRFRREVLLARQVTHPNICRLFDLAHDETGRVFFTMELLEGRSLHGHLKETGKLAAADALPLAEQIASGLAALHEHGILHRDLKPANIMVTASASGRLRAVIGDFGLARAESREGQSGPASQPSAFMGTLEYMAPELLMGGQASQATDIYAFGVTLYEMVTGARPYRRERLAVERITAPPKSPREFAPDLPAAWESAILGCLAIEPDRRPASPLAVIDELRGTPSQAPSTATVAPNTAWGKWPSLLAAAAALVLAAAYYFAVPRFAKLPGQGELAVLPFKVDGQDPALRVFADGLMESLARRLAKLDPKGKVTAAAAVRGSAALTAADAKAKLGSATAVEGSISSEGGRIKLSASLIDTAQRKAIGQATVEDDRANTSDLEEALATKLAAALASARLAKLAPASAAAGPGAQEFYLQARGYLQRTDQTTGIESAITLARRALELDPSYALAHAALADALLAKYMRLREPKWIDEALASARKAVELNGKLAETNVALGRVLVSTGRARDSLEAFEKTLAIDAANAEAHQGLGNAYSALKEYERAEGFYRKAIALRPNDWNGYRHFGLHFARRGDYAKAIEQYKTVIALTPDNSHGYLNSGAFYAFQNDWPAAKKLWERALELDPSNSGTASNLAKLHYRAGEYDRAIALFQQAIKLSSMRSYSLYGGLGNAYLRKGDRQPGLRAIGEAIKITESEVMVNATSPEPLRWLAYYRAVAGQRTGVEAQVKRALELAPGSSLAMVVAAETYAVMGDDDKAVEMARRSLAAGYARTSLANSIELRPLAKRIDAK